MSERFPPLCVTKCQVSRCQSCSVLTLCTVVFYSDETYLHCACGIGKHIRYKRLTLNMWHWKTQEKSDFYGICDIKKIEIRFILLRGIPRNCDKLRKFDSWLLQTKQKEEKYQILHKNKHILKQLWMTKAIYIWPQIVMDTSQSLNQRQGSFRSGVCTVKYLSFAEIYLGRFTSKTGVQEFIFT